MSPTKKNQKVNSSSKAEAELLLFDLPSPKPRQPLVDPIAVPLWTRSKARLVAEYLRLFIQITKHGTYIDGFSGPQDLTLPDTWAANLVLKNELLQHFFLFEENSESLRHLDVLKENNSNRHIEIFPGDFNIELFKLLESGKISQKEATFCLLDQRTFECHWKSIEALAQYKKSGYKIELFYFLANKWLLRAFSGLIDVTIPELWWGKPDWAEFTKLDSTARVKAFMDRFKQELGYKHVTPWPIRKKQDGGHLMYYMIHASDHFEAPKLMRRAYENVVRHPALRNQGELKFD